MSLFKFIISFLLLLICNICSIGQDVTVDSITTSIEVPQAETTDADEYTYSEPDTVLYASEKFVSKDSILEYKRSRSFAYAKNLDSLLKSMQTKQEYTYKPSEKSWVEGLFESAILQYFLWGLAISFILIILYKLFFTKGFFQRQSAKSNITALPDEEEPSIDADYEKLIATAVAEKNYRLAVRYLYLKSLQKLAQSGAIVFATDKTNYQYLREISSKPYKQNFAALTLNYEYVWYGEFAIDELIYLKLKTDFQQFYNQV